MDMSDWRCEHCGGTIHSRECRADPMQRWLNEQKQRMLADFQREEQQAALERMVITETQ